VPCNDQDGGVLLSTGASLGRMPGGGPIREPVRNVQGAASPAYVHSPSGAPTGPVVLSAAVRCAP